jgi:aspartate aminotransferase
MPKISNKGVNMPASPIRKLVPYADQAKREGKTVYHLNIGQPDIETPEGMLNAIKNIDFKVWAYTHSEGIPSYRAKLATYYWRIGSHYHCGECLFKSGG